MSNLDSILKSRDITLLTKICLVKALVFPVVMCGCENWTIKKSEHWRIDVFWTVVLGKTLESPLNCKEMQPIHPKRNQSWIFIGRTDAEAEAPTLWVSNAKSRLIRKDWLWEKLKAGGEGDDRGRTRWLDGITQWTWVWASSSSWCWTGKTVVLQFMWSQGARKNWATELNWREWRQWKCTETDAHSHN